MVEQHGLPVGMRLRSPQSTSQPKAADSCQTLNSGIMLSKPSTVVAVSDNATILFASKCASGNHTPAWFIKSVVTTDVALPVARRGTGCRCNEARKISRGFMPLAGRLAAQS